MRDITITNSNFKYLNYFIDIRIFIDIPFVVSTWIVRVPVVLLSPKRSLVVTCLSVYYILYIISILYIGVILKYFLFTSNQLHCC